MNNTVIRILGGVLVLSGISVWINPAYFSSRFGITFDFTDIKWPFAGGIAVLGCFFVLSSFRKKTLGAEKKAKDEKRVLMCPKCIKPFYKKDCKNWKCPDCKAQLEELSGFYERHPELKD